MRLKSKVAIVTGANSGIGLATALLFSQEGAAVVGADIEDSRQLIEAGSQSGHEVHFVRLDVGAQAAVQTLVDDVVDKYGRIDILVNSAGVELVRKATETTEEEWDRLMSTNLKGVFLCSKEAVNAMRQTGGGVIVNVASELGLVGGNETAAYCASKGGVIQLTRAMAVDHAADNIRINCVCPGPINTPLLDRIIESSNDPQHERKLTMESTLMKRLGEPAEIANVILFLASEESSYMTGSIVVADGGLTAQ